MRVGTTSFTFNKRTMRELEGDLDRATARAAGRVRDGAKVIIRDEGRVDTGALQQSIEVTKKTDVSYGTITYEVASRLEYSAAQHNGVQGPVYPRRAKVLRFKPKGSSSYVYARKTKGFEGIQFLTKALDSITVDDYTN